jgi:hypothetical protein
MAAYAAVPAVPPTVNPPASADGVVTPTMATTPASGGDFMSTAAPARSEPAPKPQAAPANVRVATASSSESGGFFSNIAKRIGFGGSDSTPTASARALAAQPPKQARSSQPPVRQAAPKPPAPVRAAESKPAPKPVAAAPAPSAQPQPRGTAIAGAQPVVPSNAFENRWSGR